MSEVRGPEGREGQPGREGAAGREGLPGITGTEGTEGEKGEKGDVGKSISTAVKVSFGILTIIFFLTLLGFTWIVRDVRDLSRDNVVISKQNILLAQENSERIKEIQASRINSCQQTYLGISKVFKPFLPKPGASVTEQQQANIDKFNDTINNLKNGCAKQTKPKKPKPSND